MLVRAARRKVSSAAIRTQPYFEQLYLPWLCPAHNASPTVRRRWVANDSIPQRPATRKRRNSNDASNVSPRRSMATAVDSLIYDDIPFENRFNMPRDSQPRAPISFIPGVGEGEFNQPMDSFDQL